MGFDIKDLHIDEESPAGRRLQDIMTREGVTLEEAVRRGLSPSDQKGTIPAAKEASSQRDPKDIIGLFSSPEDSKILDEAMDFIRENRERAMRYYAESESKNRQ